MPPEQLVEERAVQKLIEGEVRAKLDGFAVYERLLTEEEGELTPSLKVKLRVVKEKWADKVAHIFGEEEKE